MKIRFIWNGEKEKDLQKKAKLLEDMLNDPNLDISKDTFVEAWYTQVFDKQ